MQDGWKAVWNIPYVSVAFFPSLKQIFIAYPSSKVSSRPDCIFEIHQLWQSGFSRVYSNSCCSCSIEPEIIKIGQPPHKMYSNNIVNFQESTVILNACTKKSQEPYWMNHVEGMFFYSLLFLIFVSVWIVKSQKIEGVFPFPLVLVSVYTIFTIWYSIVFTYIPMKLMPCLISFFIFFWCYC